MPKQPKKSPVERAIASRQRGIDRMERHIRQIRETANIEVSQIERKLAEKRLLLDALKRGNLPQ